MLRVVGLLSGPQADRPTHAARTRTRVHGQAHTAPEISTHPGTSLHTPRLGLLSHTNRPQHSDSNHRLPRYERDRRQPSRGAGGFIGYSSVKSVVNTPVPNVRLSRAVGLNHAPVSPHLVWAWRASTCRRRQCGRAHTFCHCPNVARGHFAHGESLGCFFSSQTITSSRSSRAKAASSFASLALTWPGASYSAVFRLARQVSR